MSEEHLVTRLVTGELKIKLKTNEYIITDTKTLKSLLFITVSLMIFKVATVKIEIIQGPDVTNKLCIETLTFSILLSV